MIHIQTTQCLHRESRQLDDLRTQITTLRFTSALTNVDSSYPQKILWAENFSVRWYFNNFHWFRTTLPYLWDEILTDTFTSTNRIFWSILPALQLPVVVFKQQGSLRGIQIPVYLFKHDYNKWGIVRYIESFLLPMTDTALYYMAGGPDRCIIIVIPIGNTVAFM